MGYTPLHEAAQIGDVITLQRLLKTETFDINEGDDRNYLEGVSLREKERERERKTFYSLFFFSSPHFLSRLKMVLFPLFTSLLFFFSSLLSHFFSSLLLFLFSSSSSSLLGFFIAWADSSPSGGGERKCRMP
jgi:hypothetical protein